MTDTVSTQNSRGEYVPSIPLPFYARFGRKRCVECEQSFWTMTGYRGHFALFHILGLS